MIGALSPKLGLAKCVFEGILKQIVQAAVQHVVTRHGGALSELLAQQSWRPGFLVPTFVHRNCT